MDYLFEDFCSSITRMVYDDGEKLDQLGFDFKEHDRRAGLLCLTAAQRELSGAYITALRKQRDYYVDEIKTKDALLKKITEKVMNLDAEHTENMQRHAEKVEDEKELIDDIMETIIYEE